MSLKIESYDNYVKTVRKLDMDLKVYFNNFKQSTNQTHISDSIEIILDSVDTVYNDLLINPSNNILIMDCLNLDSNIKMFRLLTKNLYANDILKRFLKFSNNLKSELNNELNNDENIFEE